MPQRDEDWPSLSSILEYQDRVRERVLKLYRDIESGEIKLTRRIARIMHMTHEHDIMHAEVRARHGSRTGTLTFRCL